MSIAPLIVNVSTEIRADSILFLHLYFYTYDIASVVLIPDQ